MKIIGKTGNAFLVEITEGEIKEACGFGGYGYEDEWKALKEKVGKSKGYGYAAVLDVGSVIEIGRVQEWIRTLQAKEREVAQAAGMLRSLADMMEHAVPSIILAPPAKDEATDD